jgi:hypothetical protein
MVNAITEIIIAAVVAFAVGALWHGPLFGKTWMKLAGVTMKTMKKAKLTPAQSMGMGFVSLLVVAYVLNMFLLLLGADTAKEAIIAAAILWLGFVAPIVFGGYIWENKSFKLTVFNGVYRLVELAVLAVVLALL